MRHDDSAPERTGETGPIRANNITFGLKPAVVLPFEPANINYSVLAEKRKSDPTYGQDQVPDAIVNSCSECCMATINGRQNLLGRMHRGLVKSCSQCPVGAAGDHIQARDGKGRPLFIRGPDGELRPMTQFELVIMEMDGTN